MFSPAVSIVERALREAFGDDVQIEEFYYGHQLGAYRNGRAAQTRFDCVRNPAYDGGDNGEPKMLSVDAMSVDEAPAYAEAMIEHLSGGTRLNDGANRQ